MKEHKLIKYFLIASLMLLSIGARAQLWKHHFNEGKHLYNKGEYKSAYESFEKAQTLAPDENQINTYMAQAAYRAGMFTESANAYAKSNKKNGNAWSHYNEGNAQFNNNNFKQAIEAYKEALRNDPSNDVARYNLTKAKKILKEQQKQQDKQQNENQDQNEQDENEQGEKNTNPDKQDEDNQNEQQEQNQPKLGREQTEQLLESMNLADKKAQDKLKDPDKKDLSTGKLEKDW